MLGMEPTLRVSSFKSESRKPSSQYILLLAGVVSTLAYVAGAFAAMLNIRCSFVTLVSQSKLPAIWVNKSSYIL